MLLIPFQSKRLHVENGAEGRKSTFLLPDSFAPPPHPDCYTLHNVLHNAICVLKTFSILQLKKSANQNACYF